MRSQLGILWQENSKLKNINKQLENNIDYLENQSLRNNMVFYGILEDSNERETWDISEGHVDIVKNELGVTIGERDIECRHRLGKYSSNTDSLRSRSIIAMLTSF